MIAVGLILFVVLVGVFTVVLFIRPDLNAPEKADAIIVLGGGGTSTLEKGLELADEGYAPNLVFSLSPIQQCGPVPDQHFHVLCFHAVPQSTQGEARSISALASQHHWSSVIVVMRTTQATRARLRIGRCYPGHVLEVGVPLTGVWSWAHSIAYEWGALAKAIVLQPTC